MRTQLRSLCVVGLLCACAEPQAKKAADDATGEAACPATAEAPELLPGTDAEHQTLEYWLGRYSAEQLDAPLLSAPEVASYNAVVGRRAGSELYSQRDLLAEVDLPGLQHDVAERLSFVRAAAEAGEYVDTQGRKLSEEALAPFGATLQGLSPSLHVALDEVPMRCAPYPAALVKAGADIAYDRNACSTLRPQEPVQKLVRWPETDMWLARTRYALGFIEDDAPLSAPVPAALEHTVVHGARMRAPEEITLEGASTGQGKTDDKRKGEPFTLARFSSLPTSADGTRLIAGEADDFRALAPHPGLVPVRRPLTRRALLSTAFAYIQAPYGFGGSEGGLDCSRLMLDIFEAFDIALPRHSGWQAKAGTFAIDVEGLDDAAKLKAIDTAAAHGALLLHFPGHIMLYLGQDDAGRPMAIHALGEYARPCPGSEGESVVGVRRTVVSDLSVGRGSSRRSFLERLTTLVVLGDRSPPAALASRARVHAPKPPSAPAADAECGDSVRARIFVSPAKPAAGADVRVIATSALPGARDADLWLFGADGEPVSTTVRDLGGPPFTRWVRIEDASAGRLTALWTRGGETLACKRILVRRHEPEPRGALSDAVWEPRWSWERDTLNLWSAFVEQLFDYPPEDGRTWTNLHDLLRDRERNLLYDHLGLGEDADLELVPDCADLPYSLRAYFAWKLNLPFAYRQCSRGKRGVPPRCGPLRTNMMQPVTSDPVRAFQHFARRNVGSGVHSASGRTHPEDDATDMYPVALERNSLAPGTVFADPYGHVMVLTQWFAQGRSGPDSYGILMAAEAQPDGTVGRRRFFRGSFLFDPDTESVGAGFKRFRPLRYDKDTGTIVALENAEITEQTDFAPFSLAQYRGSKEDFYDRMEALIDPQPLDPRARLGSLVDGFEETVRRRVIAVDNGERFMAERNHAPIDMPIGHSLFETTGPWEDFSTPSRDLRLLISLDSVLSFPDKVAKYPERFRLRGARHAAEVAEQLHAELARQLSEREISYVRSDGSSQSLSLKTVTERAKALEVAYNPNDCIERRWGAPEGSPELASCKRRAPPEQQNRMQRYRVWFETRTRPHRGAREP